MKPNFIGIALFLCLFLLPPLKAEIRSKINSTSVITGTNDCYLINYTIYDDRGTDTELDNITIGNYNAIVGTDCPTSTPLIGADTDLLPYTSNLGQESLDGQFGNIHIYPNPAVEQLSVKIDIISKKTTPVKWSIISYENIEYLSGTANLEESSIFKVNTSSLKAGKYVLVLVGTNGIVQAAEFAVIR